MIPRAKSPAEEGWELNEEILTVGNTAAHLERRGKCHCFLPTPMQAAGVIISALIYWSPHCIPCTMYPGTLSPIL